LPEKPTELNDGLLTASEVAQLKLNADWVVLSVCNTGAAGKPDAEALSGLAVRSSMPAGARFDELRVNQAASRWPPSSWPTEGPCRNAIVAGAAQRGRANTAASIMADQHKSRATLVAERERAAQALADLKVERGSVQARAATAESEIMPLRYAAELLGMGGNDERAIRLLIALMVLCCDPLRNRFDGRCVVTAINHRLNHIWSEVPSIAAMLTRSSVTAAVGQERNRAERRKRRDGP
jgi:hypothetical protein